jgi:hypothetical protein
MVVRRALRQPSQEVAETLADDRLSVDELHFSLRRSTRRRTMEIIPALVVRRNAGLGIALAGFRL